MVGQYLLGGDNNLDLIMTEYQPRAQCNGPGTFPQDMQSSCGWILESMPVSQQQKTFGPQDDPAAEDITPQQIRTRKAPRTYYSGRGFANLRRVDKDDFGCVLEITSEENRQNFVA